MLKIKNWHIYQHYKDRNPAWIKLHFSMLSSSDWVALDDKSRVLAIACMLIASKTKDGSFEENTDYIQRVAYLNSKPNFTPLVACGFLVRTCEELQADASALQACARPETEERREETEEEKEYKQLFEELSSIEGFKEEWTAWMDVRKKKRAAQTIHAWVLSLRKLVTRKNDVISYLQKAIERNWIGVEWEWFDNSNQKSKPTQSPYQQQKPSTYHQEEGYLEDLQKRRGLK